MSRSFVAVAVVVVAAGCKNDDRSFSASDLGKAFAGCELNSRLEWKASESDTDDVQLTVFNRSLFVAVLVTNPIDE